MLQIILKKWLLGPQRSDDPINPKKLIIWTHFAAKSNWSSKYRLIIVYGPAVTLNFKSLPNSTKIDKMFKGATFGNYYRIWLLSE